MNDLALSRTLVLARRPRSSLVLLCVLVLASLGRSAAQSDPGNFTTEEVAFANGAVTLAGTLALPDGPGPHPAVIFVELSPDLAPALLRTVTEWLDAHVGVR